MKRSYLRLSLMSLPALCLPLALGLAPAFSPATAAEGPPAPPEATSAAGVSVRIEPEKAVIENSFLSIEMSTASKKLRTRAITNRITGASTSFEGEDFVLVLAGGRKLQGSSFSLERALEEAGEGGGKRLTFDLAGSELAGGDLRVRLRIEMRPAEWWAARWLEIQGGEGRLEKVSLSEWRSLGTYGPPGPGRTTDGLGLPQGYGQAAYVDDLFFGIEHPGAENFARGKRIACRIAAWDALGAGKTVTTRRFVAGAGETGGAAQAFLRFIGERRAAPPRMAILVGDRTWKGPVGAESIEALAKVKAAAAIPFDSILLEDGWDLRDGSAPLWSRLDPGRFPGGWDGLQAAARAAGIGLSLALDPAGGKEGRDQRLEIGRQAGLETADDRFCLAGPKCRQHVARTFSAWAAKRLDLIEVDGFRPDCKSTAHGHPIGPDAAVAQMDALIEVFSAWRKARPGILIAHVAGSNPSPFWLEHADFVGRGGVQEMPGGGGDPFDRHATFIDGGLQPHRATEMPISAFAVTDMTAQILAGTSDAAFERNAWWLVARTSLCHLWQVEARDLTIERWKVLERAVRWGKSNERLFGLSRMVGGDSRQGSVYGFSAFEAGAGVLALRNPAPKPGTLERSFSSLLYLTRVASKKNFRVTGVYGETKGIEGVHGGRDNLKVELSPFAVAIFEVKEE